MILQDRKVNKIKQVGIDHMEKMNNYMENPSISLPYAPLGYHKQQVASFSTRQNLSPNLISWLKILEELDFGFTHYLPWN